MKHVQLVAITLCTGLLLGACSGTSPLMQPDETSPLMQTAFTDPPTGEEVPQSSNPEALQALLANPPVEGDPAFGSVAQNLGLGSVVAVQDVTTTYTGTRFALQVNRVDGSTVDLDTATDQVYIVGNYGQAPEENPVANRPLIAGYIVRSTDTSYTESGLAVEWASDDFTDYFAGGYWLHTDTSDESSPVLEIGAFIDGPDFDNFVTVPQLGQATYTGRAGGIYMAIYGTDATNLQPEGTFDQGQYRGAASLTADFEAGEIAGQISDVELFNVYRFPADDGPITLYTDTIPTEYQITFDTAPITAGGTFSGSLGELSYPGLTVTESSGSWSGRFSMSTDSADNPRTVAGTHAAYAVTEGNSAVLFTGPFYAATERFE